MLLNRFYFWQPNRSQGETFIIKISQDLHFDGPPPKNQQGNELRIMFNELKTMS